MGFQKEQSKKSRIGDSGRLRTLVPLEVNISCGINRQMRSGIIYDIRARSLVAFQIDSDLFEYKEKARSIQMYMSTFDAGFEQIGGELNSYPG